MEHGAKYMYVHSCHVMNRAIRIQISYQEEDMAIQMHSADRRGAMVPTTPYVRRGPSIRRQVSGKPSSYCGVPRPSWDRPPACLSRQRCGPSHDKYPRITGGSYHTPLKAVCKLLMVVSVQVHAAF